LFAVSLATIVSIPSGERDDSMLLASTPIGIAIRPSNLSHKKQNKKYLTRMNLNLSAVF
jgi:chorismate-pyruvate lyase